MFWEHLDPHNRKLTHPRLLFNNCFCILRNGQAYWHEGQSDVTSEQVFEPHPDAQARRGPAYPLDPTGWLPIDQLLPAMKALGRPMSREELEALVARKRESGS